MEYRRQRLNIDRNRVARGYSKSRIRNAGNNNSDYYFVGKIVIALVLFLVIFIIASIDRPFPNAIVANISKAINNEFDIRESLGQLKFVQEYSPKIKSVFNVEEDLLDELERSKGESYYLVIPAKGEIVGDFFETGGLRIEGDETLEIISAADGTVLLIDEQDGGYAITIRHSDSLVTVYHNITTPYVTKSEDVSQGDLIGAIEKSPDRDPFLDFKVWEDGKPIDPKSLLQEIK